MFVTVVLGSTLILEQKNLKSLHVVRRFLHVCCGRSNMFWTRGCLPSRSWTITRRAAMEPLHCDAKVSVITPVPDPEGTMTQDACVLLDTLELV